MRGTYTAFYQVTSVSSSKTLMYITAPSTAVVEIFEVKVTNANVTTAEQLEFLFARISTLGTPTATTVTPKPSEKGEQAAGSTVKGNVTASEPTYETTLPIDQQGVANVAGYRFDPLPEERPVIAPSDTFGLKLLTTPGNTYTLDVIVCFREIG